MIQFFLGLVLGGCFVLILSSLIKFNKLDSENFKFITIDMYRCDMNILQEELQELLALKQYICTLQSSVFGAIYFAKYQIKKEMKLIELIYNQRINSVKDEKWVNLN